ncbi:MAG: hypothetical protein H8E45_01725 [Proteobacteria bacterium]|nr:hypothetical protein [Pseudomonadota bacterium]
MKTFTRFIATPCAAATTGLLYALLMLTVPVAALATDEERGPAKLPSDPIAACSAKLAAGGDKLLKKAAKALQRCQRDDMSTSCLLDRPASVEGQLAGYATKARRSMTGKCSQIDYAAVGYPSTCPGFGEACDFVVSDWDVAGENNDMLDCLLCMYDAAARRSIDLQVVVPRCGDGMDNRLDESCDDGNDDSSDACLGDCRAASCGDGFVWAGQESCDNGDANSDTEADACRSDCTPAVCGDGTVDSGEECDDSGESASCDSDCSLAACGDGTVNASAGETCDDSGESASCNSDCTVASCGDGTTNTTAGESCDDGNADNNDACLNDCSPASCGDGFTWAGLEDCDDANTDNNDSCLDSCVAAACGDGFTWTGMEDCDDANADNGDACLDSCAAATCGDGFVFVGNEQCDDGSANSDTAADACRSGCELPSCGDGVSDSSEQCDDGNADDTDSCLGSCVDASCGDGHAWAGVEDCDTAGESASCNLDCSVSVCGDGKANAAAGEACDAAGESAACDLDCSLAFCGDGTTNTTAGEACDTAGESVTCDLDCSLASCGDGTTNATAGETCDTAGESASCNLDCSVSVCGDGKVNSSAGEQCDAAGESGFCDGDCTVAVCGDGTTNATAGEACDDANNSNADACLNNCASASCGDGFVFAGQEACDDGNSSNADACLVDCSVATCGDGFVFAGQEACDDGNADNGDACLDSCAAASCGDGFLFIGEEECDDGNNSDTDSCSAGCEPQRVISADVVALDQVLTYNRWGSHQAAGMIFALRRDVVDLAGNPIGQGGMPGQVMLRPGKRPRPLVLRANEGDVLQVHFTNLLAPARPTNKGTTTRLASMMVNGTRVLGDTHDPVVTGLEGIEPGQSTDYWWKAGHEGTKLFYSLAGPAGGGGDGGQLSLGLFGAFNVEPENSSWYRSQVTAAEWATVRSQAEAPALFNYDAVDLAGVPVLRMLNDAGELVHSDLNAIIAYDQAADNVQSTSEATFREFSVIFHDEIELTQGYPQLDNDVLKPVSDSFAINYGSEGLGSRLLANRLGEGPAANCLECPYEEFFLESAVSGDPALLNVFEDDPSNVHHSYINDNVKFRNLHAGPRYTHIFHLHAHQWLANSGEGTDDNSVYLDSQTIAPMSNFTYEIQYGGAGNRNKVVGDSIFHCHLYPHFAQGMWELWRAHDVLEDGTRRLMDGELGPGTNPLTGVTVGGTPIPALVPMPDYAMAPEPSYGPNALPGYPFYMAQVAGHRAPQAPFDVASDGGLPRHVFTDGGQRSTGAGAASFDFHVEVQVANIQVLPQEGTALEQAAMAFHASPGMTTTTPEGDAAFFELNGLPSTAGAPYAEPCPPLCGSAQQGEYQAACMDGCMGKPWDPECSLRCEDCTTAHRTYHVSYIELDLLANAAGWHDPQGRINVLDSDVSLYEGQSTTADPFFFRANSGECITFKHTNRAPKEFDLDDFQVRTPADVVGQHIHLVKFDVTSSDGSGNGWNYEDGTYSAEAIAEWTAASNALGGSATSAYDAAGNPVNVWGDGATSGLPTTLTADGGFQTTTQRWWADPLLNKHGQDRSIRTVFTHDHFFPSTGQQHGFYNALTIEPAGSQWLTPDLTDDLSLPLDPARGVGTQAYIVAADSRTCTVSGEAVAVEPLPCNSDADCPEEEWCMNMDHREFMMAVADLALLYTPLGVPIGAPAQPEAISRKGGTDVVNYRNEPFVGRGGPHPDADLPLLGEGNGAPSDVFSSWVNGDPFTEIFKAREGERMQVRLIQGAQQAQHSFNVHGSLWPEHIDESESPMIQGQPIGISEHFECDLGVAPPVTGGGVADYLYHFGANDHLNDGSWGLIRVFADGLSFDASDSELRLAQLAASAAGERDDCLEDSPARLFEVEAWRAADLLPGGRLVYNQREDIYDPNARIFLLAEDRAALAAGTKAVEPLVLRANSGDCITVLLTNHMPDTEVSMHPQRVSYDVRYSDGANVGLNFLQTAMPGETINYRWFAGYTWHGHSEADELGPGNLRSYGDFLVDARQGLLGALVIEEAGASWADTVTGTAASSGTAVDVTTADGETFREFVVLYQEDLDLFTGLGRIPDADVDQAEKAFNYRTENFWARLGAPTTIDLNDVAFPADFFSGPIETPLFRASDGQKVRFHVLQPSGGPLQHTFLVQGHDYPDNRQPMRGSGGASVIAPFVARTMDLEGGARAGTWLYHDGTGHGRAGGLWGRLEVD